MQLQSICQSMLPSLLLAETKSDQSAGSASSGEYVTLLNPPLSPPSATEEIALRQVLLSGYCDSIARKAPIGMVKEGSRRQRLTAYFSCNPAIKEPLYIHPQSNLYHSDPTAALPEFLVYGSLLRNQKGNLLYMTNVSVVSSTWIAMIAGDCPLLSWGKPLLSPSPIYDLVEEKILCHVVPKFGTQAWSLPAVKRAMDECVPPHSMKLLTVSSSSSIGLIPLGHRMEDEVYRWFARFLLEGLIGLRVSGALVRDRYIEPTIAFTQNKIHPKVSCVLVC
jgi:hypothetical protein